MYRPWNHFELFSLFSSLSHRRRPTGRLTHQARRCISHASIARRPNKRSSSKRQGQSLPQFTDSAARSSQVSPSLLSSTGALILLILQFMSWFFLQQNQRLIFVVNLMICSSSRRNAALCSSENSNLNFGYEIGLLTLWMNYIVSRLRTFMLSQLTA